MWRIMTSQRPPATVLGDHLACPSDEETLCLLTKWQVVRHAGVYPEGRYLWLLPTVSDMHWYFKPLCSSASSPRQLSAMVLFLGTTPPAM
jgi:hypothetical protein